MTSAMFNLIACPACKSPLAKRAAALLCRSCGKSFPIVKGIPRLFPPSDDLTIDPAMFRIKSWDEAADTIERMSVTDVGFITSPRIFYAAYLVLLLGLVAGLKMGVGLILAVLAADWAVYLGRRGRFLERDLRSPLRLRTAADHAAVDEAFARAGRRPPTMADWVALSRGIGEPAAAPPEDDDERYEEIARAYQDYLSSIRPSGLDVHPEGAGEPAPPVVADIGANDGRAYRTFGVGRGAAFVAVDVSRELLAAFAAQSPEITALQADGMCLPLRSGSVDFLFCTETLEHIAEPEAAVVEFARVLKPGGRLMIQSPNAHRIRNLNPFHLATLATSILWDRPLQKKTVHENTWHNGVTFHWDFSRQDYTRMAERSGLRVRELGSRAFFFPRILLGTGPERIRDKERRLASLPILRFLGNDLVMVAEKPPRA